MLAPVEQPDLLAYAPDSGTNVALLQEESAWSKGNVARNGQWQAGNTEVAELFQPAKLLQSAISERASVLQLRRLLSRHSVRRADYRPCLVVRQGRDVGSGLNKSSDGLGCPLLNCVQPCGRHGPGNDGQLRTKCDQGDLFRRDPQT